MRLVGVSLDESCLFGSLLQGAWNLALLRQGWMAENFDDPGCSRFLVGVGRLLLLLAYPSACCRSPCSIQLSILGTLLNAGPTKLSVFWIVNRWIYVPELLDCVCERNPLYRREAVTWKREECLPLKGLHLPDSPPWAGWMFWVLTVRKKPTSGSRQHDSGCDEGPFSGTRRPGSA